MPWSKAKTLRVDTAMDKIAIAINQKRTLLNLEILINSQHRKGYVDDEDYRKAQEDIEQVRQWVAQVIVKQSAVAME